MRELTDHIVSSDQAVQLRIQVLDEPGAGGANHIYRISDPSTGLALGTVSFQNGPIKEAGVNGVTQEALLAIIIDRLRSFQDGPFHCYENAMGLTYAVKSLQWLQDRTMNRIKQKVEGTHELHESLKYVR